MRLYFVSHVTFPGWIIFIAWGVWFPLRFEWLFSVRCSFTVPWFFSFLRSIDFKEFTAIGLMFRRLCCGVWSFWGITWILRLPYSCGHRFSRICKPIYSSWVCSWRDSSYRHFCYRRCRWWSCLLSIRSRENIFHQSHNRNYYCRQ